MSLLRQPERNDVELENMGEGVSTSLSGPQLVVGDGGGREKEMERCKRINGVE